MEDFNADGVLRLEVHALGDLVGKDDVGRLYR